MRVFVTGGSGFVGRELIRQLLAKGHHVRALVRSPERLKDFPQVEIISGDTTKPETLKNQLADCDAVIHLVGIIREVPSKGITFENLHTQSTAHVVAAAQEQGVKRYLQMSANGTNVNATTKYHKTKWRAEEMVKNSGLAWTLFRPSLIFGPDDAFINMLAKMVKLMPVIPVFGDGRYALQPVHVRDVAASFVAALEQPATINQTYHCCGPEIFSYDELLDTIGKALGKKSSVCKFHQPLWLIKPMVAAFESISIFPITSDQLNMLLEGNICADKNWAETFSLELIPLTTSICEYVA